MNLLMLLLLIGIMTCFLDRLLVVIWICSLGLEELEMILWIWLTFWVFNVGKVSLILMTFIVLFASLDVCTLNCFEACTYDLLVKIEECGLSFFFIFFLILFSFQFIFHSAIFRTLGLRIRSDQSHCHISHIWCYGHNIDHRTWEKKVEGSRTKGHHTIWTLHVGLIIYTWSFRVGCTVDSTNHLYKYIR